MSEAVTDENPFRIVLIAVAVVQTVISLVYLKRARAGSTILGQREEGILLTAAVAVCYIAYGAAVVAYLLNPAWMAWSAVRLPVQLRWFGTVPVLLGGTLLIWGLEHLGANLTISISTRQDHALITTGPFRWVRHPLYTAGMVESVGVCLLMANWFVALSAGLFWAFVVYRTPLEENKLIDRFGDEYEQYMSRVGRFAPKIRR